MGALEAIGGLGYEGGLDLGIFGDNGGGGLRGS